MLVRTKMKNTLDATRHFWNTNPCGGLESWSARQANRYRVEPWLRPLLAHIAASHSQVVEVGCGQGTDGITLCSLLPEVGNYLGLDYSEASLASARQAVAEAQASNGLRVLPRFQHANAEQLPLADNSVECIYSVGVLHHTPDEAKAASEVVRVLRPGGRAYILLYNCFSPKVALAKLLRGMQHGVDFLSHQERIVYRSLLNRHGEQWFGTMWLECFGVPVLNCHGPAGIRRLFPGLIVHALHGLGNNIHGLGKGRTPWGVFWFLEAEKPNVPRDPA